jgi:hypothetical protein
VVKSMVVNIEDIKGLNLSMLACMEKIEQTHPEDELITELVSQLHNLVGERQSILETLISDPLFVDRELLAQQFDMTQTLIKQSTRILDFRQSLLQVGIKTKRQINVYKAIGSNR